MRLSFTSPNSLQDSKEFQRMTASRLGLYSPNPLKTLEAAERIFQHSDKARQKHELRVSKLQSQMSDVNQRIKTQNGELQYMQARLENMKNKAMIRNTTQNDSSMSQFTVEAEEIEAETERNLQESSRIDFQHSFIRAQDEAAQRQHDVMMQEIKSLQIENQRLRTELAAQNAMLNTDLNRIAQSASRGGTPYKGTDAFSIDSFVHRIDASIELVLKQLRIFDEEESRLNAKIQRLREPKEGE